MTFVQIRYFLEVARHLNFTEAARTMNISQQVVSKQIYNLEKDIGIRLFDRSTKRVELTEAGKSLFDSWQEMMDLYDQSLNAALKLHNKDLRKVKIGVAEIMSVIDLLSFRLEKFLQDNSDIDPEYRVYSFKRLVEMLEKDELDIVVSLLTEFEEKLDDYLVYTLLDLNLGIFLSKKHPLSNRGALEVKDISNETLYVFSKNYSSDAKDKIISHCRKEGFEPKDVIQFDNVHSMELALNTGKGVTISYSAFFRNENNLLKFYPVNQKIGLRAQKVVVAMKKKCSKSALELVEFLTDRALPINKESHRL
ncbi:LysR family transcriptional regulator [Alkalibacter mobilis]|uniref:LysR family transcriptional regulator n=1 Tax=Alkalibacter mobilis TaxID=2787712 RepID=UPI00189E3382|nr:LysR family transcriptional regulator [Alkalibacter mobilis]MBF7095611.1 LysR family transcriptional regulator [Alkalibacter mobilis]